jgi:oligoribonuclease
MTDPRALFCWFDTEYTTLELERAKLLEVALIVTDDDLSPIVARPDGVPEALVREDGFSACVAPPPIEEVSDHVRENFGPLLDRCAREGRPIAEIDALLERYLDALGVGRTTDKLARPVLAGNSIYADYFLARKYLPGFLGRLSYRLFDVTTFKLEWQLHYRERKFDKQGGPEAIARFYKGSDPILGAKHDAYFDVQASIAELGFYRSHLKKI